MKLSEYLAGKQHSHRSASPYPRLWFQIYELTAIRARYTICGQRYRLGDDIIEAVEWLKSWIHQALMIGKAEDVERVSSMLVDMCHRASEVNG